MGQLDTREVAALRGRGGSTGKYLKKYWKRRFQSDEDDKPQTQDAQ